MYIKNRNLYMKDEIMKCYVLPLLSLVKTRNEIFKFQVNTNSFKIEDGKFTHCHPNTTWMNIVSIIVSKIVVLMSHSWNCLKKNSLYSYFIIIISGSYNIVVLLLT